MSDSPTLLAQAQAHLQRQLSALPENRRGAAALIVTEGESGHARVQLAVASRLDRDTWDLQIGGTVAYEAHHVEGGAELLFTWGGK